MLKFTVVNLTLIDLPGLTKVAVGKLFFFFVILVWGVYLYLIILNTNHPLDVSPEGQPDSIVAEIENMVHSYIEKVSLFEICLLSFNSLKVIGSHACIMACMCIFFYCQMLV